MPLISCPNCAQGMQAFQRQGIEIDICPQCRGVWLDRGELEKLLSGMREAATTAADDDDDDEDRFEGRRRHAPRDEDHGHADPRRRKKRSLFEMFDIFD